ncbi:hypothetical protein [Mycobacterium phage WXIN]|nr:hypothetical protein [Mycobacterium phage WXIN]
MTIFQIHAVFAALVWLAHETYHYRYEDGSEE